MQSYTGNKRPSWIQVIAICLAVAAVSILATNYVLASRYQAQPATSATSAGDYSKLDEIRSLVDAYYVGEYDEKDLLDMLAVGFMYGINDPWSYYTAAEDMEDLYEYKTGSYVGIGVTVTTDEATGLLMITEVAADSPAAEAGIRCFDYIYTVEGESVTILGMDAAVAKVRGEPGTTVNLEILRDELIIPMTVERRNVDKTRVTAELIDGEIGYIRVSQFTTTSPEQFTEKLATLKNIGAKGYIIDMRNNPGGRLYSMYQMLDELMPEGEIFVERDKAGNENRLSVDNVYYDEPVIVLVNEYSISAAEYFAAVMQERGRAVVVGTPTTGKGMAQQTFELSDGSSVSFSVLKYYTPNGVNIGETGGILPDMTVEMTYEQIVAIGTVEYSEDPQIVAAVGYMKEYLNR